MESVCQNGAYWIQLPTTLWLRAGNWWRKVVVSFLLLVNSYLTNKLATVMWDVAIKYKFISLECISHGCLTWCCHQVDQFWLPLMCWETYHSTMFLLWGWESNGVWKNRLAYFLVVAITPLQCIDQFNALHANEDIPPSGSPVKLNKNGNKNLLLLLLWFLLSDLPRPLDISWWSEQVGITCTVWLLQLLFVFTGTCCCNQSGKSYSV